MSRELVLAAAAIAVLNLPFGCWRAGVRKLSPAWFLAVHVPVLLAVGVRLGLGVGLRWTTFPVLVAAFATGQFLGGRLRRFLG